MHIGEQQRRRGDVVCVSTLEIAEFGHRCSAFEIQRMYE
jgi:hypothetical protein